MELGSTATVIEGQLRNVLETVAKVTEAQLHHDPRVLLSVQLDVYPGQQVRHLCDMCIGRQFISLRRTAFPKNTA